jgi:hypothetical protein
VPAPQSHGLVALAAIAVGTTACALISGLSDFSERAGGDAGAGMASPPLDAPGNATGQPSDAMADLPSDAAEDVGGSDASSNDAAGDVGGSDVPSNDAETSGDASDGGRPGDAAEGGPVPDGGNGGCQLYTHANGLGQTFTDCVPLDTYDTAQATKACAAADAGTCVANSMVCFGGATLECTPRGSDPCSCWSYSGSTAGHVATTHGLFCGGPNECPMASDNQWH